MSLEILRNQYYSEIQKAFEASKEFILNQLYMHFAYWISYEEKVEITHDYDPEYDCSGSARHLYEKFNLNDYKTVEDFCENEYTGGSTASFESGCGLYWDTYSHEVHNILSEHSGNIINNISQMFYNNHCDQISQLLITDNEFVKYSKEYKINFKCLTNVELQYFQDTFEDVWDEAIDYECDFNEIFYKTDAKAAYKEGLNRAVLKKKEEENRSEASCN